MLDFFFFPIEGMVTFFLNLTMKNNNSEIFLFSYEQRCQ